MKPPLFVRPLTPDEQQALRAGLRSPSAFTLRRCQILRPAPRGSSPPRSVPGSAARPRPSATPPGPSPPRASPACSEKSHRPVSARPEIDDGRCERLRALLHRSPRDFGKPTSLWTLELAAEVACAEGITDRQRQRRDDPPGVEAARRRLEAGQDLDHQPRPGVRCEKKRADRLIRLAEAHPEWVLGFQDEVWWSRLARPDVARLGRRRAAAAARTSGRRRGPRPEGAGLLRAAARRHRNDAAAVRPGPPGQPGHRGLPGLGLRAAGGRGQDGRCC